MWEILSTEILLNKLWIAMAKNLHMTPSQARAGTCFPGVRGVLYKVWQWQRPPMEHF